MQQEWDIEAARIKAVREVIANELINRTNSDNSFKSEMRNINKGMWEDIGVLGSDLDAAVTFMQHIGFLKQNISDISENSKRIIMLEKQYNSPYFCRIDFKEDEYETESFYIGIYGLRKANKVETLIYDWRAPVSSLFYDYEPGRALYECPSGNIEGDLLLKRQYRIENGELKLMFDCNVAIEDDILQDILARNTGSGMKTIVSTIQREQNRAIRYEGKKVFAVAGPAGSGKTSIALHRAAYLLYRHRNNLKAENIALFTPNGAFAEYISTVLPELGEENIQYHTLITLVKQILGNIFIKYEAYEEYMENILLHKSLNNIDKHLDIIRFKASKQFITIIEQYVRELENAFHVFSNISTDDYIFADKDELDRLFHISFSSMPIAKRLSQIKFMIKNRINDYEMHRQKELENEFADNSDYIGSDSKALSRVKVTQELERTKKALDDMCSLQIVSLYRNLFSEYLTGEVSASTLTDEMIKQTVEALEDGILHYEDQAPIIYMMSLLGMIEPDKGTKYVIIDEAQDYSEAMYRFLFHLYSHSNIAILGDPNQNINFYNSIGSLKGLKDLIKDDDLEYLELSKSYRSTQEIMNFALRILSSNIEPYGRHGLYPEIICANTLDALSNLITEYLMSIKAEKYNSIAIICRTLKDCRLLYNKISNSITVNLINNGDNQIPSGIIIIPSYLTKGLEFDVVAAVIVTADDYAVDEDTLLYTVCTRALHRLDIFTIKDTQILKKLLPAIK
jgi:DNA helicase-2/ATP-dependent DNA helicase PcrA